MKIVQFIPSAGSWGDLTPDTMNKKGLGGRETALVKLAENWANRGHEVINFVPTEAPHTYHYGDGVSYFVPASQAVNYLKTFGADVLVSWEEPRLFSVDGVRQNVGKTVIEMQVAHMSTNEEMDELTDNYAVLSQWAGDFLLEQGREINPEKIVIFPNGVDLNRYSQPQYINNRKNEHPEFYYSSSPDRGLVHLLKLWPRIREMYPGAKLNVCYGLEHWIESVRWIHNMQAQVALDIERTINQDGIIYRGRIGQDELARIQERSDALLYTCDTMQPTETGCITVVEAGAACSPAIITDCDCLGYEFLESSPMALLPFNEDDYLGLVKEVMEEGYAYNFYQKKGRELAEARSWDKIADQWLTFFNE